jgi:hypothetical protein
MKVTLTILALLFVFTDLLGQNPKHEIQVEFHKEGRQIKSEDYQIYFVISTSNGKTLFKPKVINSAFAASNFCGNEKGHILIKYQKHIYGFGYCNIAFNQSMKLVFGLDKKPLNRDYSLSKEEQNHIQGLAYVEFHPLEKGEGTVTVVNIENFNLYLSESKKMLE